MNIFNIVCKSLKIYLPIVIGTCRFKRLSEYEIICTFCLHQTVEYEQQFSRTCSLYSILRNCMYINVCHIYV